MPLEMSLLVPIVLAVLGCNVLCLLVLLVLRPPRRRAEQRDGLNRPFRACAAEAVGTFALALLGSLASLAGGGPLGAALAQGLVVTVMMAGLGRFSGGHFNPAITLGVVAAGRLHPVLGLAYWLAQLGGAMGAAWLFAGLDLPGASPALPAIAAGVTVPAAVVLEAVAVFFLVLVVFGSSLDERAPRVIHPLAVGLTVSVGALAIGAFTGGLLNPARFLGQALLARQWTDWTVWVVGPCLGGGVAAVLMQFFFLDGPLSEFAQEFDLNDPPAGEDRRAA